MDKLLLVEDDTASRDMLSRRLQKKGYEVVTATDGAEGVERALAEHPDLIVIDLNLPVMDGLCATRLLKSELATRSTPVIVLTAHAMAHERAKAFEAGCDEFESKPVEFDRLVAKIDALLTRPQANA